MAKAANQTAFPLDAEVARAFSEWHLYLLFHLRELEKVAAVASPTPSAEEITPVKEPVTIASDGEVLAGVLR